MRKRCIRRPACFEKDAHDPIVRKGWLALEDRPIKGPSPTKEVVTFFYDRMVRGKRVTLQREGL